MEVRDILQAMNIIDKYITFRSDPENDERDDTFFCTKYSVSLDSLIDLKKEHPLWGEEALKQRRVNYAEKTKDVDASILRMAKAGDAKSAELWYRRFDAWNPKNDGTERDVYDFAALAKLAEQPDDEGETYGTEQEGSANHSEALST